MHHTIGNEESSLEDAQVLPSHTDILNTSSKMKGSSLSHVGSTVTNCNSWIYG
jgi:hypothetical protein